MRKDHPLRKRFEGELERLRKDLEDLERGQFRIVHRTMHDEKDVDVTQAAIDRTKYNVELYESILADED